MSTTHITPLDAVSSPNINAERLAELKRLFPDLFSNEGRLNIDELKKVVDPSLVTESERYDFRWYGKTASKREAFTPSRAALVYDPDRSVNPDKAGGNIIIEGENLEVLKQLNCAYRERIKCIYIDPPYNTGKDFVYSDRFAEGQKPYWEQTGVTDNGVKVDTNSDSDGRFHSNWLSMMHSRLLVARYLLRPDGIIFVSIDDNENQNMLRLMNDVFGEECNLGTIVRATGQTTGQGSGGLGSSFDYILVYAKDPDTEIGGIPLSEDDIARFSEEDCNGKYWYWQLRKTGSADRREDRPNMAYKIKAPDGSSIVPIGPGGYESRWRCDQDKYKELELQDMIVWKQVPINGVVQWWPYVKYYLEGRTKRPSPLWIDVEGSKKASTDLKDILGARVFEHPKPVDMIKRLLQIIPEAEASTQEIVLDFFGGSGTTAQAVIEQNKADGGTRQFILVQLPELTEANSPAFNAGYKRISDITFERTKRVIQKFQKEAEGLLPGDEQRQFADSLGFKVYKLEKSAFPRVEFTPDPEKTEDENVELLQKYIADKEQSFHIQLEKEKVRDEVLLKQGFMLDYAIIPQPEFTKNEVVLIRDAHKESLLCLDIDIAPATVDYFQNHKDHFFICLELALDTTKKWNLKHHLADKLKAI